MLSTGNSLWMTQGISKNKLNLFKYQYTTLQDWIYRALNEFKHKYGIILVESM